MSKPQRFFVFGDQSWPVESLIKTLPRSDQEVSVWIDGRGWLTREAKTPRQSLRVRIPSNSQAFVENPDVLEAIEFMPSAKELGDAVAIVGFKDPEASQRVVEALKDKNPEMKILKVGERAGRPALQDTRRSVAWGELLSPVMDQELNFLNIQNQIRDLRELLKDADQVAILLQDDPDPDGLASALALRKVLGRKTQTAPIVSMGRVTRPENVAMLRLLEIEVDTVTLEQLNRFDRVVMVDCQPSFFKGRQIKVDAIIDHHPRVVLEGASTIKPAFEQILPQYGSVSTMMTEYLRAADVDVSQRLSTALLYGIKSDTLHLNREVSEADLEAFVYLYPRINKNILRRIERPELPFKYLKVLSKALTHIDELNNGRACLFLGEIEREEWSPQAADFALQIEGAEWAMACGIYDGNLVISGRNCGFQNHCGDLFKVVFDGLGAAGGHRTMAKAIIPTEQWIAANGARSLSRAGVMAIIERRFKKALGRAAVLSN